MKLEPNEYCPCCGYDTFRAIERLEYSICPICYWEDDPFGFKEPEYEGGSNRVSLIQAQQNFKEFDACEKDMIRHTRKPTENDNKNPDW